MTRGGIKSGLMKNGSANQRADSGVQISVNTIVIALAFAFSAPVGAQQQQHDQSQGDVDQQAQVSKEPHRATETPSGQPDVRDPHAYAEGEDFGPLGQPRLSDQHNFGALIVDHLEAVNGRDNSSLVYDFQAWYGRTFDRLSLRAVGDVDSGTLQESATELLWSHAVASFWDTLLGVRYDTGVDPDRRWLAGGIQGLVPYWFEVVATAYVGEQGSSQLLLEGEYDLLLTQRLILRPQIEAVLNGQSDDVRQTGSGLSEIAAGLRLRYEFTRQFAPYVGVEWVGKFGDTANYAKAANENTDETFFVAGVRLWF
jgi:copper resistance protein B